MSELKRSFDAYDCWYYKIPDAPINMRFQIEKPFDSILVRDGKFIAIEGKALKKFEAFGMRHLRPSQIKNLEAITKQGARGYVFLNIRVSSNPVEGVKRENRLLIWEWEEFKRATKNGSIKQSGVISHPYIKGSNKFYDLQDFIDRIDSMRDFL